MGDTQSPCVYSSQEEHSWRIIKLPLGRRAMAALGQVAVSVLQILQDDKNYNGGNVKMGLFQAIHTTESRKDIAKDVIDPEKVFKEMEEMLEPDCKFAVNGKRGQGKKVTHKND